MGLWGKVMWGKNSLFTLYTYMLFEIFSWRMYSCIISFKNKANHLPYPILSYFKYFLYLRLKDLKERFMNLKRISNLETTPLGKVWVLNRENRYFKVCYFWFQIMKWVAFLQSTLRDYTNYLLLSSYCLSSSIAWPIRVEEEIGVQRMCFCSHLPHRENLYEEYNGLYSFLKKKKERNCTKV